MYYISCAPWEIVLTNVPHMNTEQYEINGAFTATINVFTIRMIPTLSIEVTTVISD